MEIERKFLLSGFPDLPELERAEVFQGYLGISPEVRIRSKRVGEAETYRLCFKGEGSLVREEIELDLDKATFESLKKLLPKPMIRKEYRIYRLENGLRPDCSIESTMERSLRRYWSCLRIASRVFFTLCLRLRIYLRLSLWALLR